MGRLGALGMAEQVGEGNIALRQAVSWHLTSNHYPPHPSYMVPVALAAIEAGQDEEWDRELELPKGCQTHTVLVRPRSDEDDTLVHANGVPLAEDCVVEAVVQWRDREDGLVRAGDVIESFHLDSFLD